MWLYASQVLELGIHALASGSIKKAVRVISNEDGKSRPSRVSHPNLEDRLVAILSPTNFAHALAQSSSASWLTFQLQRGENTRALVHVMEELSRVALAAIQTMIDRGDRPHSRWEAELNT
jgi:hypothetical protein